MAEMKDLSATDASNTARFPENQQPSTVNNGARALEGLLARFKADIDGSVSSAGTNTITLAAGSALSAYAAGDFFVFKAGGTNTGAATINVDSVGAKTIQKNLAALVAGDITANDIVAIYYDGTQFQMISPARTPVLTAGGIAGASVAIATASTRGSVEFATDAETITGSSTVLALTPANLQAMTGSDSRDGILELATAAEVVTGSDTARAVTPAGLHGAATLQGQHTIWVPASAMEAAVTTAAATSNAVEIGTSLFAARTMDFATGADDFCYFGIQMPKSWDAGTLVCQFVWSATGTTANTVLWAIAATSLGDDEVLTTAFPTPASPAADTNSTTADDLMVSAEVTLTVGSSPTAEDFVIFEVSRDVSGDTLAEDARLHGIKIHYTTSAGSDT